jgi:hypothetical protein
VAGLRISRSALRRLKSKNGSNEPASQANDPTMVGAEVVVERDVLIEDHDHMLDWCRGAWVRTGQHDRAAGMWCRSARVLTAEAGLRDCEGQAESGRPGRGGNRRAPPGLGVNHWFPPGGD